MTAEAAQSAAKVAGAIDIGSNALRMAVAQVYPDGRIEVLERARKPVRIGRDTFTAGRISQEAMNAAIEILRDYRRILDTYGAEVVRTVATSAVREAINSDAFVDRVAMAVDLDVELIEPAEQSMLIVSAVRHAVAGKLDLQRRVVLIAEAGGGSTVLTIVRQGQIAASESYNIGSIRMQEILATAQEPPLRAAEIMRHHIASTVELARRALGLRRVRTFVAIGGDARFAAKQVGEPIPDSELHNVPVQRFHELVARCLPHTADDLARTYGLPFADAETLVPALLVYEALLNATRAEQLIVSQVSLREGLLYDMPRFISGVQDPAFAESVIQSARTIALRYRCDEKHGEHVADLAVRLFDALQREHGLSPRHRLLLQVAGILHEVGGYVSSSAHHKHSYYLIANSEIFGLRQPDTQIVAHVARYHRRSSPKRTHLEYVALPRDRRMAVNKLAALLRVADALDRGHWQQVKDFTIERRDRELVILIRNVKDLALERRAVAEKGDLFEDIFGLRVRLDEAGAA